MNCTALLYDRYVSRLDRLLMSQCRVWKISCIYCGCVCVKNMGRVYVADGV